MFSPNSPISIFSGGTLDVGGFDQRVLSVSNQGTVILEAPDILTINGNYAQGSGGTLVDQVHCNETGFITASGTGSLAGALAVAGQFSAYTQYHLLYADGGVVGQFNTVKASTPLVNVGIIYDPDDVYFSLQPNLKAAACTKNQCNTASQIDCIADPSCDEQCVVNTLINGSVCQATDALDAMAGEQFTYLIQLDWYGNARFNENIYNGVRFALNPCKKSSGKMESWTQVKGGQCFADGDRNSRGLKSLNWDFSGGVFKPFEHGLVGIAGNYQLDYVDFYQGGDADFYTGQASLYGAYKHRYVYVLADFIFGESWGSMHRKIDLGTSQRKADSSPNTTQYFFYLEAGPSFCWNHVLFQPYVSGDAGIYQQNGIQEHDARSLDLNVHHKTLDIYDTQVGTHLSTYWGSFTFSADLAWQHRYGCTAVSVCNTFNCFGCPFDIKGVAFGNDGFIGALNFSGDLRKWVTLYGSVSGSYWNNWASYGVDLGVNFRW